MWMGQDGRRILQHRTYILFTEGGGGGGSRRAVVGWFCMFIFLSKFIDEKLSSNPSSPEGYKSKVKMKIQRPSNIARIGKAFVCL